MSLRFVLFDLTLFARGDDPKESRKDLGWMLEALTQRDQAYLKEHPDTPLLYQSGVVYERPAQFQGLCPEASVLKNALGPMAADPQVADVLETVQAALGGERFRDIGRIIEKGEVDCDNLGCWRAAELRQNGIAASPFITWRQRSDGGTTYHVLVRWPDNTLEDPSLLLGMSQPERAADRQEEIRKNNERIQMVKDAAARKPLPTSVVGAGGHRNAHRNDHRNISQPVLIPWDEYGMVDLDLDLDDDGLERSFDERLLQHTGLMRGM